jgi:arsenate reductase
MNYLFVEYPKCSTCQKAKKFLTEQGIRFNDRHIVEQTPTKEELRAWYEKSGLPLKRFFNTNGLVYKDLGLKDRLSQMSEEEQLELLSSNGMLIKRPMLIGEKSVLVGFKPAEWEKLK